jgi:integrase
MSLYKRGEIWWVYITVDGQRARRSTHTSDKKKAEAFHDNLKVSLRERKESGKTLTDAFKIWLKASDRTPSEQSALRTLLQLYPNRPLSEVNGHAFHDALASKSAGSYNRIANNVRAAINMAHKRGWCEQITIPRKKTTTTKLRFLTKVEWKRIENELPEHLKPMAQFAISTGLRQANVLNLMWSSVDLKRAVAWIDATEAKGNKSIPVPLSKYAVDILKSQEGKNEHYVFTYRGEPISSIKTSWNKALIRAKIDLVKIGKDDNGNDIFKSTFRWHDLRHTWASWHVMNGTPLAVLKELGGWHDISMVMRYAHLSPDHLAKYAGNSAVA